MNLRITGLRVDNEMGMELTELDLLRTIVESGRQEIVGRNELGDPEIEIPGSKQKRPPGPDIPFLRGLTVF